ncbi:hypothetical protein RVR_2464 [Actinacidiphila reveromycinica]|uniref:Clostridial hydrophobic W n=2 Tax=Actinacidiphila reveromycinica TaxID=659352 RepID=A0A7U3UQN1_9ACTN|nr:hypothetical protein RVR_2464 [Streptomyces sp. SN-593]
MMLLAAGVVGVLLVGAVFLTVENGTSHNTAVNASQRSQLDALATVQSTSASPLASGGPGSSPTSAAQHPPKKATPAHTATKAVAVPGESAASATRVPMAKGKPMTTGEPLTKAQATTPAKAKTSAASPVVAAVEKAAAAHSGRHVCYRAYLDATGWQAPVCDGAVAGSTGKDQPIKALDFAWSGADGGGGTALMKDGGWQTGTWPSVKDGADLNMGTTAGSDVMSGFTIGVSSGSICQTSYLHQAGWMGKHCSDPGSWIFGGTKNRSLWIEAVEFTV